MLKKAIKKVLVLFYLPIKVKKQYIRVLSSLAKQDMPKELFEIIIVINGEKDNTEEIINAGFSRK